MMHGARADEDVNGADDMGEQTDEDEGLRPLSPEERIFVRHLRPILDDPDQVERLKRLLQREPSITQVSENFDHLSWGGRILFRTAIWLSGIVGGVVAYQTVKTWAGIK
jgi:hypothetical protein